jgi:cytochrome oxidase Cu insertion factor (SCO1/SenC/PrrC family)
VGSLLIAGLVLAELLPPARPGLVPRSLAVLDDHDRRRDLRAAGAPTLLVPIFTRCTGTCPLTAVALKDAMAGAPERFRVLLLSFDTEDAAADLRDFRERLNLPSEWLLVRSIDGAATREFFDDLDFHFMKAAGGFDHPNQTFVFSPKGAWAATFSDNPSSKEELESAHRRAMAADHPSALRRLGDWLFRPEAWIALACAGIGLSLAAILLLVRRDKTPSTAPAPRDGNVRTKAATRDRCRTWRVREPP